MINSTLKVPTKCPECEGTDLFWFTNNVTYSGVQNGHLKTSEVTCLFVLGCHYCSATVATRKADDVAEAMNKALAEGKEHD